MIQQFRRKRAWFKVSMLIFVICFTFILMAEIVTVPEISSVFYLVRAQQPVLSPEVLTQYPLMSGYPVNTGYWINRVAPVIIDLDNDGQNELLVGNSGGYIYRWDASGHAPPGWPIGTGGRITGHLAIADLTGDGKMEIVAAAGSRAPLVGGKVYVWQADGSLLSGWPKTVAQYNPDRVSEIRTVVLADLDQDGDLEIIVGTNNYIPGADPSTYIPDIYAWHHNGTSFSGNWPISYKQAILGALAVADFNGDGHPNIVTGRDLSQLFAYDHLGKLLPGWPVETFVTDPFEWDDPRIEHTYSAPVLADLEGDGVVDYIVDGLRLDTVGNFINCDVMVMQPDGTRKPGWEIPASCNGLVGTDSRMFQAPAVADLNSDGRLDIVVPTQDGWLRVYNADKTLQWAFNFAGGKLIYGTEPAIGDVDDDGLPEVIFGTYDPNDGNTTPVGLYILEHTGQVKAGMPISVGAPGIATIPTLGDLDKDGDLDIAAATLNGRVYVWDLSVPYTPQRYPWPTARQNLLRTAFVDRSLWRPDLELSTKQVNPAAAQYNQIVDYTITLLRTGLPLTTTVTLTDAIPSGLQYVAGSLNVTGGVPDDSHSPILNWSGLLSDTNQIVISYQAHVTSQIVQVLVNTVTLNAVGLDEIILSAGVIINGYKIYLPIILDFG